MSRFVRYARSISSRVAYETSGGSAYAPFTRRIRAPAEMSRSTSPGVRFRFAWRQIPTLSCFSRRRSQSQIVSSVVPARSMSSQKTRSWAFAASRTGSSWESVYPLSINKPNCVGFTLIAPRIPWAFIASRSRRYSRVVASTRSRSRNRSPRWLMIASMPRPFDSLATRSASSIVSPATH